MRTGLTRRAAIGSALIVPFARAALADDALVAAAQKEASVVWYSTLIVNQLVRPVAEAFVDYVLSADGMAVLKAGGFAGP